uniref:Putative secreted protein n=1 Tax=Anopheles darlingi TaxID=43151 RepID=A0A2M4DRX4_ANODA
MSWMTRLRSPIQLYLWVYVCQCNPWGIQEKNILKWKLEKYFWTKCLPYLELYSYKQHKHSIELIYFEKTATTTRSNIKTLICHKPTAIMNS